MSVLECRRVLSQIARDDENNPSERMKAISLLVSLRSEEKKTDSDLNISIDYGGAET